MQDESRTCEQPRDTAHGDRTHRIDVVQVDGGVLCGLLPFRAVVDLDFGQLDQPVVHAADEAEIRQGHHQAPMVPDPWVARSRNHSPWVHGRHRGLDTMHRMSAEWVRNSLTCGDGVPGSRFIPASGFRHKSNQIAGSRGNT